MRCPVWDWWRSGGGDRGRLVPAVWLHVSQEWGWAGVVFAAFYFPWIRFNCEQMWLSPDGDLLPAFLSPLSFSLPYFSLRFALFSFFVWLSSFLLFFLPSSRPRLGVAVAFRLFETRRLVWNKRLADWSDIILSVGAFLSHWIRSPEKNNKQIGIKWSLPRVSLFLQRNLRPGLPPARPLETTRRALTNHLSL